MSYRLRCKLEVESSRGAFIGDARIRLLEAIEQHGSISQAARHVPLSYKAAWDAVDAMNNLAETPLVLSNVGGKQGGGAQLTGHGRKMVALYRVLEGEYQRALDQLAENLGAEEAVDLAALRGLLRRMSMKTSARNQFAGVVVALSGNEVEVEVRLAIEAAQAANGQPPLDITAVITRDSATALGLAVGAEVTALVKASSVMLMSDTGVKTSARNQLWGEIVRIHDSLVNAEVVLGLPGGRRLCAVVTHDSLQNMGLTVGMRVGAAFKASAVILCQYA